MDFLESITGPSDYIKPILAEEDLVSVILIEEILRKPLVKYIQLIVRKKCICGEEVEEDSIDCGDELCSRLHFHSNCVNFQPGDLCDECKKDPIIPKGSFLNIPIWLAILYVNRFVKLNYTLYRDFDESIEANLPIDYYSTATAASRIFNEKGITHTINDAIEVLINRFPSIYKKSKYLTPKFIDSELFVSSSMLDIELIQKFKSKLSRNEKVLFKIGEDMNYIFNSFSKGGNIYSSIYKKRRKKN